MTSVKTQFQYNQYLIKLEFSYLYVGNDSPYGPVETSGDHVEIYCDDTLVDDPDSLPSRDQIAIEKAIDTHILEYLHNYDSQAFYTALQL